MSTTIKATIFAAALGSLAAFDTTGALAQQAPDRSKRPAVAPVPELRLPALQEFTLPNGLRVLVMEKHDLPLVQVNLLVDAGSVRDAAGRLGVASLTADMLDEGAAGRSALARRHLRMLGARFGVGGGLHFASATLRVPAAPGYRCRCSPMWCCVDFPAAELGGCAGND
jgi:hypothetical protein